MHCQGHWWVRSWYPKLRLCCPATWSWQSSAAVGGATEALQFSPEDGAPTLEGRSGPLAQTLRLSQLPPGQKDGLTADQHDSPSSSPQPGLHHVGWGKGKYILPTAN